MTPREALMEQIVDEAEIIVTAEVDEIPIRGNAIASGDDDYDREVEDWIIKEVNAGNVWAWASVCVELKWNSLRGDAYLGCCSYESEEDFRKSGYFGCKIREAAYEIVEQLDSE